MKKVMMAIAFFMKILKILVVYEKFVSSEQKKLFLNWKFFL